MFPLSFNLKLDNRVIISYLMLMIRCSHHTIEWISVHVNNMWIYLPVCYIVKNIQNNLLECGDLPVWQEYLAAIALLYTVCIVLSAVLHGVARPRAARRQAAGRSAAVRAGLAGWQCCSNHRPGRSWPELSLGSTVNFITSITITSTSTCSDCCRHGHQQVNTSHCGHGGGGDGMCMKSRAMQLMTLMTGVPMARCPGSWCRCCQYCCSEGGWAVLGWGGLLVKVCSVHMSHSSTASQCQGQGAVVWGWELEVEQSDDQ